MSDHSGKYLWSQCLSWFLCTVLWFLHLQSDYLVICSNSVFIQSDFLFSVCSHSRESFFMVVCFLSAWPSLVAPSFPTLLSVKGLSQLFHTTVIFHHFHGPDIKRLMMYWLQASHWVPWLLHIQFGYLFIANVCFPLEFMLWLWLSTDFLGWDARWSYSPSMLLQLLWLLHPQSHNLFILDSNAFFIIHFYQFQTKYF